MADRIHAEKTPGPLDEKHATALRRKLCDVARKRVRDSNAAEDAVQDVLVSTLGALQHASLTELELDAYAMGAVHRSCAFHCRRHNDRRVTPLPLPHSLVADDEDHDDSHHNLIELVAAALSAPRLTEKEKRLVACCARKNFAPAQAATTLGIAPAHLFRMARKIGEKLRGLAPSSN